MLEMKDYLEKKRRGKRIWETRRQFVEKEEEEGG
jgi:hypothetical protein